MSDHFMNEQRLEFAMQAAGLDLWESDLLNGVITRKATKIFSELGYGEEETSHYVNEIFQLIHPDDLPSVQTALDQHISGLTPQYRCDFRLRAKNGEWVWYASIGKIMETDGLQRGHRFIGVTYNVDLEKRAELERQALVRAHKLLSTCSTQLIRATSEQSFLDAVCQLAVEIGGYLMAWIGYVEQDAEKSVRCRAQSGYEDGYLDHLQITWEDCPMGRGPVGVSIRTKETIVNHDYHNNPAMAPWREAALERGYRASIALPLIINQQVIGVLSTYSADQHSYSEAEVSLLEELARNVSYGIEALRIRAENAEAQSKLTRENEKYLALLRNASDGIHILDAKGNVLEVSDSFCSMLGYRREEIIGQNVSLWDTQWTPAELAGVIQQQIDRDERSQFETRHRRKDGSVFDVEVSGYPLSIDGRVVLFNSSRDITARKQAQKSLQQKQRQLVETQEQYAELLRNLRTAIVVHAPDTSVIFSNPRASELLGLSEDQMQGKTAMDSAWCFVNEQGAPMRVADYPVNRVLATKKPLESLVLGVNSSAHQSTVWLLVSAFPELNAEGRLKQIVVNFDDITARKQAEGKIYNLAFFDALTNLPNRRLLMDRIHSAILGSVRSRQYGAVLFIDMDKFKMVNDVFGHEFGDLLLIEVANRIRLCVRECDTVARLGGDEFVVLVIDLDEQSQLASQKVAMVAEKIRLSLSEPYLLDGNEQHSSPSIGVSLFRGHEDSAEVMLRQADMAMYKAKDAGRNAVRFFNPEMQLAVETHAALETDLRHAVPGQQLRLYYQVQVDQNQQAIGAEALLRWVHPQHGMISPMKFIPIAEESSLILEIGAWVLREACQQIQRWQNDPKTRHFTLAVNVSAQQFRQADFVDEIARILQVYGFHPSCLKLELTESVVLNDVKDVIGKMHALRALGVKLSLDDFGTGYSSLSYLKQLPLDQLKIDQTFVRDIMTDPNDAVMVKTIIDLANNFHLQVIAEGVETEAQLAFLKLHGCLAYQGYLFSKPVPMTEFEQLLNSL